MDTENLPDKNELIGHEAGNYVSAIVNAWPEKEGQDSLWMEGEEAIVAFNEYKKSIRDDDIRGQAEALRTLESFDEVNMPAKSRESLDKTLDLIDSAEAYERMLEEGYEKEIPIGEVMKPFEWYDGIDVGYDELDVIGSEALRAVSNTIVKNWLEHGDGLEDDSRMWVEYEENEDDVVMRIYDDGPGWPDEGVEFDSDCKDQGIGLCTANFIAEEYGGDLTDYDSDTGGAGYEWTLQKA